MSVAANRDHDGDELPPASAARPVTPSSAGTIGKAVRDALEQVAGKGAVVVGERPTTRGCVRAPRCGRAKGQGRLQTQHAELGVPLRHRSEPVVLVLVDDQDTEARCVCPRASRGGRSSSSTRPSVATTRSKDEQRLVGHAPRTLTGRGPRLRASWQPTTAPRRSREAVAVFCSRRSRRSRGRRRRRRLDRRDQP